MRCEELETILAADPEAALTPAVSEHVAHCADCRALAADLDAICAAAREFPAEEEPPVRVWARIELQLESEGLIRDDHTVKPSRHVPLWSFFQRPAFAGSILGLLLVAAGIAGVRSFGPGIGVAANETPQSRQTVLSASLNDSEASISSMQDLDPDLKAVFTRDLTLVDNEISMCEKSVREEPGNDLAREYLNDAYQQKAQLLAVAMDRGTLGGR